MHEQSTAHTTPDLTPVAALHIPLEQAGWTLDAVTEMSAGSVDYLYLHPSGRQIAAVTAPAGEPVELTLTGLTLDQAVGAVTGAGYAPAVEVEPTTTPTPDLLAAVRQVIDAGHLEWGTGVDVDRAQGEAHAALVRAYQAATGGSDPGRGTVTAQTLRLTHAISLMALRYGDARADRILAMFQSGNDDETQRRLIRAQHRRLEALVRLTRALAELRAAQGGAR